MVILSKIIKIQLLLACICFTSFVLISSAFGDGLEESNVLSQKDKLEFITSIGRAAIDSPEETSLARRRALEDALYLASLRGGAKVNGFSSVGTGTELNDNFVVRPTAKILDYAVVKEVIKETHYEVTVKVAVGNLDRKNCTNNNLINLVAYKPSLRLSPSTPAWLAPVLTKLYMAMLNSIEGRKNVEMIKAYDITLKSKILKATDDQYDYTSLTTGRVRTSVGSFAYVPEIIMSVESNSSAVNSEKYLVVEINSSLYHGFTYKKAASKSHRISLKLGNNSPWRTVNILSRPSNSLIVEALLKSIEKHTDTLFSEFECQPLQANIQLNDKKNHLVVSLGKKHGLTLTSLAYTKGTNTPWVLFKVESLTNNTSVLRPLDPRRDISKLDGKMVEFLEVL